ncbi:MAG: alpha-ketoacid dehydrogenase subunit beta [Anaerolineae bacterium]|jgi:pyruvate dehydrogenase E1 component beta subunit|nr:alpha-ketoacid dehydrogenase subunit beta [Anaerolineae bacterium]
MATKQKDRTRVTIREAISEALREEMLRDDRVFIMGEEVGVWGGTYAVTRGFHDEFGDRRVKDTPISEMAIVGVGAGAAMAGLRPVSELMTINFAFLALDAIVNHVAKVHYMFNGQFSCPLVIRTTTGGGRQLGATHSHSPEPIFAHFPGVYVVCPATPYDAKGLLKAAIRSEDPVLFVEHATLYQTRGDIPVPEEDDDFVLPIGVSDRKRQGSDVTLVTFSKGVYWCMEAAEQLSKEGIECDVIDLRCLRPLDLSLAKESLRVTNRAVVVEESLPRFGVGAEVIAQLQDECFDYLDAPLQRVTAVDTPLPYSRELEQSALPNADKVIEAVRKVLK